MAWDPIAQATDVATIGGKPTPGICEIVGASSPRKWDEIAGYGWSGGILVFHGLPLSHFIIRFTLYTAEDWIAWHELRPLLTRPPLGKRPRALVLRHPQAAELGIFGIVVELLKQAVQVDDGVWQIEVDVIESRQYKQAAIAKPDGAEEQPPDPRELEIERLTGQNNALADEAATLEALP